MLSKFIPVLAIFTAATAVAAPAHADVVSFAFNGNQLETQADVAQLYRNIEARAERLCTTPGRRPISDLQLEASCSQDLTSDFVSAIDHPALTRLHTSVTISEL